jgi:CII-binding regulator of phage lambda lysogenization HflD
MMESIEHVLKLKNGQTGPDGNRYLRSKRVEVRFCQQEYQLIEKHALASGYSNIAQYLRESGLTTKNITSPTARQKDKNKWLYEINRIGNNINQIARQLNQGQAVDDEVLLILAQIQDMASETLRSAQQGEPHRVLQAAANEDVV